MNARRASFLLLVAVAVSVVAMPVWGQTTTSGSSAADTPRISDEPGEVFTLTFARDVERG